MTLAAVIVNDEELYGAWDARSAIAAEKKHGIEDWDLDDDEIKLLRHATKLVYMMPDVCHLSRGKSADDMLDAVAMQIGIHCHA